MKKFLLILPLVGAVAACETQNQSALTGAAAGAALGAVVSNDSDRAKGAVLGGLAGAAAGGYLGRASNGQCVYQNSAGQRYTAACP
ncbi:YMGG-like Gly-zipper [Sulfitobacter marinus]|uniref:17 kDa surface antigen n=1 Tax=Sulfitobacter marinus TaxID=394264 RepID=A0A1I6UXY7_9RHOB|nr:glycine zipper 2TM domain-containing protein [Sulfitobacter marinus]SFT06233.1 YMGG-like Gly-zipper [Sulfitobacter marinus]